LVDIRDFCEQSNAKNIERNDRIAALETKIAELESRPFPKWAGVFTEGQSYGECSLVTDKGALWVATRDTAERPGAPASGWRLIVKSGGVR
jgi:hypothetical protein